MSTKSNLSITLKLIFLTKEFSSKVIVFLANDNYYNL